MSYLSVLVDYFKSKRKEQLAASEILPEQSPLDKALVEIVKKIEEAEKTCEKLMILMKKNKILEEQPHKMCVKKYAWDKL